MKKAILIIFCICQIAQAQQLTSSNLPIILIDTKGQAIIDEPKTQAQMKIINNGIGKRNNINDKPTDYNGNIGIEYRGSSSQIWPKKPYGFELQNDKGEGIDASILGFPAESDFTLFASYNERSLLHATLAFHIARQMFTYASRTQHVELVINGEYQGVYVVMEKIKRSENRVNISKLREEDIEGDQLTGGYIIKIDKGTGNNSGSWKSQFPNNNLGISTQYFYDYPKPIRSIQKLYIENYVDSFEVALQSPNFADAKNGYRRFINTSSFAKTIILNEVSKNVDGYRISTYLYKDRTSKGGKLTSGPPWDYDFTFGMPDYCDAWTPYNFIYSNFNAVCNNDLWVVPFFWIKLMQDKAFVEEVKTEYTFQRLKGDLQIDKLKNYVDSMKTYLNEAQARNFQRWRILGRYDWPTKTFPATWEGEVAEIMPWLEARLQWMDTQWLDKSLIGLITSNEEDGNGLSMKIYPNPVSDKFNVLVDSNKPQTSSFKLTDESGKTIYQNTTELMVGSNKRATW